MSEPSSTRRSRARRRARAPITPVGPGAPSTAHPDVARTDASPGATSVAANPPSAARATGQPSRGSAKKPKSADPGARDADRTLRDLVGAGPSQLSIGRALRARDANRPTDDELARAEADLVIVRRNWTPQA